MTGTVGLAADRRAADPADPGGTTARILDATYEQLLTFGLRGATVEEVARRAGVARITVYRRFGGKDDLVRAVLVREGRAVFAEVDTVVGALDHLDEQVVEGFVTILRIARSHPLLQRLLTTEPLATVPSLTTHGAPVVALGREYLAGHLLADPARTGSVLTDADARAVAEVLVRLTLSFLLTPESVVPLASDDDARAFARRFVLPAIHAATAAPVEEPTR